MREQWITDEGHAHSEKHRADLIHHFRKIRAELDAFEPDFVLLFGDDQYENYREDCVPPFSILAYDAVDVQPWKGHRGENWWDEPKDKTFTITGHRAGAKHLASALLGAILYLYFRVDVRPALERDLMFWHGDALGRIGQADRAVEELSRFTQGGPHPLLSGPLGDGGGCRVDGSGGGHRRRRVYRDAPAARKGQRGVFHEIRFDLNLRSTRSSDPEVRPARTRRRTFSSCSISRSRRRTEPVTGVASTSSWLSPLWSPRCMRAPARRGTTPSTSIGGTPAGVRVPEPWSPGSW